MEKLSTKLVNFEFGGLKFYTESRTAYLLSNSEEITLRVEADESEPEKLNTLYMLRKICSAGFTSNMVFHFGNGIYTLKDYSGTKLIFNRGIISEFMIKSLQDVVDPISKYLETNPEMSFETLGDYLTDERVARSKKECVDSSDLIINIEGLLSINRPENKDNAIDSVYIQNAYFSIPSVFEDTSMRMMVVNCKKPFSDIYQVFELLSQGNILDIETGRELSSYNVSEDLYSVRVISTFYMKAIKLSDTKAAFITVFEPTYFMLALNSDDRPIAIYDVTVNDTDKADIAYIADVVIREVAVAETYRELIGKEDLSKLARNYICDQPNFIMSKFSPNFWVLNEDANAFTIVEHGTPEFVLVPAFFSMPDDLTDDGVHVHVGFKPAVLKVFPDNYQDIKFDDDRKIVMKYIMTQKVFSKLCDNWKNRLLIESDSNNLPFFIEDPEFSNHESRFMHFIQLSNEDGIDFFYITPAKLYGSNGHIDDNVKEFISDLSSKGYILINIYSQGYLIIKQDKFDEFIDAPL